MTIEPTSTQAWKLLEAEQKALAEIPTRALFEADPERFAGMHRVLSLGPSGSILCDWSKHRLRASTMTALLELAREVGLPARIEAMFGGEKLNTTERRAVLHVALRNLSQRPIVEGGADVMPAVRAALAHMHVASDAVRSGSHRGYTGKRIEHVVNIGIGGSDLGPLMVTEALKPYALGGPTLHFVSNVDGTHLAEVLRRVDPETTLFLIASKTFTTQETLENAKDARAWFLESAGDARHVAKHFFAISTNEKEVTKFGIDPANMFVFWDWVGGRYSLWSSIGLSIAMGVGFDRFQALLEGAHLVDEHLRTAPLEENLPVILGLLGVWNTNFWGAAAHAVLPYDQYLHRLPAYLQQADMESNGKGVMHDGRRVSVDSGPVLFGEPGTNGQHAFYQLIHQGTRVVPCDFLVAAKSMNPLGRHQTLLLANVLAQSEALMRGKTAEEARTELTQQGLGAEDVERLVPHKVFPGSRPSTVFLYDRLDPKTLGALIALYEHRVFVMGVIWGINSFDQWGVELGKQLANVIVPELAGNVTSDAHDGSTRALIDEARRRMNA
jgi:glucose-6-phosphate isomerase